MDIELSELNLGNCDEVICDFVIVQAKALKPAVGSPNH